MFDDEGACDVIPPEVADDFAARCCSCNARRSSLLNFGRGGGMTRLGGGAFFFLVATAVAGTSADDGGICCSCDLDMINGTRSAIQRWYNF